MCEISIIIPVYNKKRYITDTVKAVLNQTFFDYELLLIDDGSTDGSGEICDKLARKDERINVVHTINRGVGAARNAGIKKARGKYISFIDADDYIDKCFLEKLYKAISENDAGMVSCDYYEFKNNRKIIRKRKYSDTGNKTFDTLKNDTLCILWNKLLVRENIKHLFDENSNTCEDSVFCARYYYDNDPKVVYVDEVLYGYIIRDDGLTSRLQDNAYEGVNKYLAINKRIVKMIDDEKYRLPAFHHICRVYYYGIYLFVFENLSKGSLLPNKIEIFNRIFNDKDFRKIMWFTLKYPYKNELTERTSLGEKSVMFLSLLKMKRTMCLLLKLLRLLERNGIYLR